MSKVAPSMHDGFAGAVQQLQGASRPASLEALGESSPTVRRGGGASAPCVSIGLPVFNGARYIRAAIDSVLAQSFADFELIISDNGSTDRTAEICRRYAEQDCRIRLIRLPVNQGAAPNYNSVVRAARGRYFKWLAHDDVLAPSNLARCVEVLERCPDVVLCYPKTLVIDECGGPSHCYLDLLDLDQPSAVERYVRFHEVFASRGECNAVFGLIRRPVLLATAMIGRYPSSDQILLGELALHGRFVELDETLFLRRDHSETSIRANPAPGDRATWFDESNRGRPTYQYLNWFWGYWAAIARSPLARGERLACYRRVLSWGGRNRRYLSRELFRWGVRLPRELWRRGGGGRSRQVTADRQS